MTKRTDTKACGAVLLVDADPKEIMQLHQNMPKWLWVKAPNGWPFEKEAEPMAQSFQAIIVFAGQGKEKRALDVCKHIREQQIMDGVLLLIAANRYQMALVNKVKKLSRGNFIFTPIEESTLLNRIKESQDKEL